MAYKNEEKILVVLDLDETLLHTTSKTLQQPVAFDYEDKKVYARPHLKEFLKLLQPHFLLAIWSSGSDDYVELMVEKMLPRDLPLEFVWGRGHCTSRSNVELYNQGYAKAALEMEGHYHFIKPLKKLKRKGYSLDRILMVDDSPYKCRDNYGNAIYVSPFIGNNKDDELSLLVPYLLSLKTADNVRNIEKRGWKENLK